MPISSENTPRVAESIFVGREAELASLRQALSHSVDGRGSSWLLVGEPGIGKTRTAVELAGEAAGLGADVFWGRCRASEGAPAFWPWIEIVRAYARGRDDDTLVSALGEGAADIAQIVPALRERGGSPTLRQGVHDRVARGGLSDGRLPRSGAPDVGLVYVAAPTSPSVGDGPAARFALFESFAGFLDNAARQRPLLIVVDDLHWADLSSLQLLEHLLPAIRTAPIMVVGTYRPVEVAQRGDLSDTIGQIARHARSLPLAGLSRGDVATYLRRTLGAARAGETSTVVYRKTRGNALFMGEIARLLAGAPHDDDTPPAQTVLLTDGIRHAIRNRLETVSTDGRDALRMASAIGREFDSAVLGRIWLDPSANPADASPSASGGDLLEQACGAGIVERGDVPGRYRFCHPLVRDTLYDGLESSQRPRLHRAIARVLESLGGECSDAGLGELAHHFVRGASFGDRDKAIHYAKQAGDHFRRQFAYGEAAEQYASALGVLDLPPAGDPDSVAGRVDVAADRSERVRAGLLVDLGRAQSLAGDASGGQGAFARAVDVARAIGDDELLAHAVLGIADPGNLMPSGDVDKARLIEEALTTLGPGDHPLRALLLTRSLLPLYYAQDRERVLGRSAEAVAMAERVCDDAALGQVLGDRLMVLYGPDLLEERADMAQRLLDLAHRSRRRSLYLAGHNWTALNLLQLGEVERARAHLDRRAVLAEEQRQPFDRWQAGVCQAMLALLTGELESAETLATAAYEIGEAAYVPNAAVMLSIQIFRIRLEQGRLAEIEPTIVEFARGMAHIPAARGPLALAYGHMGRTEASRRSFEAVASAGFDDYPRDSNWLTGLTDAAHVCWFVDDRDRAALLYEMLLPHAQLVTIGSWFAACSGVVGHYLGLLATVLGRWEEASEHFATAAKVYRSMGARPLAARAGLDYADMLLRSGGDRSRAADLLRPAIAACAEIGMPSWRARGEDLLARIEGTARVVSPATDGERDVAGNLFRREGDWWTLRYDGQTVRLKNLKGMHHLRTLLREPGREFHVADLADAWGDGAGGATAAVPDAKARTDYRRRIEDVRSGLDEADANNDLLRATRYREELDGLTSQLAAAYSPGAVNARGRNAVQQNIRKAVAKNVRAALLRIQVVHEPLWRHLYNAVHTGIFCSYRPERACEWVVD